MLTIGVALIIAVILSIVIAAIVTNVTASSSASSAFFARHHCLQPEFGDVFNFANSSNLFNQRLYHNIQDSVDENINLVLSSYSVASVLGMVLAGAKGVTASEIRNVLVLPCLPEEAGIANDQDYDLTYLQAYKDANTKIIQVNAIEND